MFKKNFMRIFFIVFLLLAQFFLIGSFFIYGAYRIAVKTAYAQELSPLDFISDCNSFTVSIGRSRDQGRFITYSYEFLD